MTTDTMTKNKKETTRDTHKLADVAEVVADGTSIGKSTAANRLCHFYRERGRPVTLVQIESGRRRAAETGAAGREITFRAAPSRPSASPASRRTLPC